MKKTAKMYERVLWLLTAAAVMIAAAITVPKIIGIQPYVILSSSMEPVIPSGSLIYVNTRDRQAKTGDIVTFTMTGGNYEITVTHRIVGEAEGGYVTKGDNNQVEDLSLLTSDQIVGTYMAGIPHAGYWMSKVTRKMTVTAAIWLLGFHLFGFVLDALAAYEEYST